MTPKEKAIELHNKILNVTYDDRDIPGEPTWVSTKCALIAVDEIINGYEFDSLDIEHKRIMDNINFWDEVKAEIQKL